MADLRISTSVPEARSWLTGGNYVIGLASNGRNIEIRDGSNHNIGYGFSSRTIAAALQDIRRNPPPNPDALAINTMQGLVDNMPPNIVAVLLTQGGLPRTDPVYLALSRRAAEDVRNGQASIGGSTADENMVVTAPRTIIALGIAGKKPTFDI